MRTRFERRTAAIFILMILMELALPWAGSAATNDPFMAATFGLGTNTTLKGIAIRLGQKSEAAICFDTELLRYSGGWTNGFASPVKLMSRGEYPTNRGDLIFTTASLPGWGRKGDLKDPRGRPWGSLPRDWAKYRGLYVAGEQVVLSYYAGSSAVLEVPGFHVASGIFTRTIQIDRSSGPMALLVCAVPPKPGKKEFIEKVGNGKFGYIALDGTNDTTVAGIQGAPPEASWENVEGQLYLRLPPIEKPVTFRVSLWRGDKDEGLTTFAESLPKLGAMTDPKALMTGGAAHWPEAMTTVGEMGKDDGAYAVDALTVPYENPWKSEMLIAGMDFFPDGKRAAVCTFHGDVWIVSGIDERLEKLTWKRYAAGLYHALGLAIKDDRIYVTGRDQITRLHDLNGDGEADFYECFNNDCVITENFHEFALDLQTDPQGNFYFAKAGPVRKGGRGFEAIADHHGTLMKVSKDGSKLEVVATGFRAPNGIGVGPNGELTTGENEGTWTPVCRLNWVKPGGFYGVVDLAHRTPPPSDYDRPLCWLPKAVDNSGGGQAWVTSDKWGPFQGELLHLSYGTCSLFKVLKEDVDGQMQGGVVRFPFGFNSGMMRARFNPADGQLYLAGMKGWQTSAAKTGGFQRVRFTGKAPAMPAQLHARKDGVEITFTVPLEATSAGDAENYGVSQWNYVWSAAYGSPEISADAPAPAPGDAGKEWTRAQVGDKKHDEVTVKAVRVSADRKTVFLEIPTIKPVMQMRIKYNLKTAEGVELAQEIYNTIHRLGAAK